MKIAGQMCGLRVTAHQKFLEAAYFFDQMETSRTNVEVFPHNLSAFLAAFRSITYYLQVQFSHDARFSSWYELRQAEMRAHPTLRNLHRQRRASVHESPFELYFQKGIKKLGNGVTVVVTDYLQIHDRIDDEGQLKMTVQVGRDGPVYPAELWVSWHFEEGDRCDVADHCHRGLEWMHGLLEDLATLGIEAPSWGVAAEEG